mmetsp:Transcript_13651/g.43167  ORF Transcript_13651/g.43167 Transcript_13651/m.43167 type:complete len:232 (+) Transcript_13651:328-1023(+)
MSAKPCAALSRWAGTPTDLAPTRQSRRLRSGVASCSLRTDAGRLGCRPSRGEEASAARASGPASLASSKAAWRDSLASATRCSDSSCKRPCNRCCVPFSISAWMRAMLLASWLSVHANSLPRSRASTKRRWRSSSIRSASSRRPGTSSVVRGYGSLISLRAPISRTASFTRAVPPNIFFTRCLPPMAWTCSGSSNGAVGGGPRSKNSVGGALSLSFIESFTRCRLLRRARW